MVTKVRRKIHCTVRMMQGMETPKKLICMEQTMLEIHTQIKEKE
jgi:hypothetical protein